MTGNAQLWRVKKIIMRISYSNRRGLKKISGLKKIRGVNKFRGWGKNNSDFFSFFSVFNPLNRGFFLAIMR